jgi:hypothetical protein
MSVSIDKSSRSFQVIEVTVVLDNNDYVTEEKQIADIAKIQGDIEIIKLAKHWPYVKKNKKQWWNIVLQRFYIERHVWLKCVISQEHKLPIPSPPTWTVTRF